MTAEHLIPFDTKLTVNGFGNAPDDRLSIVVPTKNEAKNVEVLLQRVERAFVGPLEVIFVDDSDDDTPAVIETVRPYHRSEVVLIRRTEGERADGLGGAVATGLEVARANLVCVMNADLRRSPELVARMRDEARSSGADLVVARRTGAHEFSGETFHTPTLASRAASLLAHFKFPRRVSPLNDPSIAYFLLRKGSLQPHLLAAQGGFATLLEKLACQPGLHVAEIGSEPNA